MMIIYRDELGAIAVETETSVSFCDGKVYFTDANENDHVIDIMSLIEIQ